MPLYTRKRVMLSKRETTYGVDAVPTGAADALLLRSLEVQPLEQEYADRELVRPHYGQFEDLPVRSRMMITKEIELAGFGTAGPATPTPAYSASLRAAGLAQTIALGVDVKYSPVSAGFDSVTDYFYLDGTLHKMLGGRNELELRMELNQIPVLRVMTTGLYGGVSDAALPTPTVSAYQRPLVVNQINTTGLSLHGLTTARLQSFSMSLGNVLVHRNLVGGSEEIILTDRQPSGEIQIQAETVAVMDWWTRVRNATLGALSITHGLTAGNRVKFDAPNVQLTNPRFSESDGITHLTMGLQLMPGAAGNDEFTLTIF